MTTVATDTVKTGIERLIHLGEAMDRGEYPCIGVNGSVVSGSSRLPNMNLPEKERYEHAEWQGEPAGSIGSEAGQGEGTTGSGPPRAEAAETLIFVETTLNQQVRSDLEGAFAEYRPVRLRVTPNIVWFLAWVHPIAELPDRAWILVSYPVDRKSAPRAWAWWDTGVWIGPRHTNIPDGSICAFAEGARIWKPGDSLLRLLDLYAGWVLRHLHLRHIGRWPGDQAIVSAHERWLEQEPDELCGCGSGIRYRDCHSSSDNGLSVVERYIDLVRVFGTPRLARRPPSDVCDVLTELCRGVPVVNSRMRSSGR